MEFNDVALIYDCETYQFDIEVKNDDLVNEPGLETAIIISLFTDARVEPAELPSGQKSVRGWWGNLVADIENDEIGSKLWTLDRAKQTAETVVKFEDYSKEALQWLIADGVADAVDVSASFISPGLLELLIDITRPEKGSTRFEFVWNGQEIKRG